MLLNLDHGSFAIPGSVIGVSYVFAFNVPPLELTGTGIILVIAFVFRNKSWCKNVKNISGGMSEWEKLKD